MALITAKKPSDVEKVKIEINKNIYEEIQSYCQWAGIDKIDHFFEESATFIFSKDRDWKKLNSRKASSQVK